jgi:DNA-binding GntR family transcriptional regulator
MSNISVVLSTDQPAASLAEKAYYAVREMIVSLELRPGAVVDEQELMARLEIGRTPVREALQRLAQEKLVEVYPRRGVFVTSVEIRDLASLSEVRSVLESQAARLAATRATDAERQELRALIEEIGARGDVDDRTLMELDERIHRQVYRCAHNELLAGTLEEYYALALRIWFLALDQARDLEQAVLEHRELLEAVCDGDEARAADLMHRHVLDFELAMRRALMGV